MSVPYLLLDEHIAFETLLHPPAYTAQKRAKYLGISGRHVAKSVLLAGPAGYFLAVLPATEHVDTQALAAHLGGSVCLAEERAIADLFLDCEWGVVSPFGSRYGLTTFLEDALSPDALLIFEPHMHAEDIRMCCRDYEKLEQPRRLRFAQRGTARTATNE